MSGVMNLGHVNENVQVLSSVKVPEMYYKRITTGVELVDELFGGDELPGIFPGMSILFTGFPGAGKTTMALQLADLLQENGANVLYNVGEQNRFVVKLTADRLRIKGNFCVSQFQDIDKLLDYCKENHVEVLVQDSLQTLIISDDDIQGNRLIREVGEKLAEYSCNTGVVTFMLGHITKSGEFAGPMQLKHTVDAHAHLSLNKETGYRIFELKKNRFGPAYVPYEFFMGQEGLDFRQVDTSEENKEKLRGAQKREIIVEKAKDLLVKGHKLSGYSHDENDELVSWLKENQYTVSGGYWRGILGYAARELERENNVVKRETINRREHIYLEA